MFLLDVVPATYTLPADMGTADHRDGGQSLVKKNFALTTVSFVAFYNRYVHSTPDYIAPDRMSAYGAMVNSCRQFLVVLVPECPCRLVDAPHPLDRSCLRGSCCYTVFVKGEKNGY